MRHGTVNAYANHRCRCDLCRAAKRHYALLHGEIRSPSDLLRVSCWCEEGFVLVPRAEVLAGRTASCSRSSCRPVEVLT